MRRGSIYIALWGLLVACVAAGSTPVAASAATVRRARMTGTKQTTSPKLKIIHLKLLGKVAPGLEDRAGWLYTDGVRWAAYEQVAGTTRIIDTKTGHTSIRPDPEGCSGGLIAVGGGEMLYKCANPECPEQRYLCNIKPEEKYATARLMVENIVTGVQTAVAGESHLPSHADDGMGGQSEMEAVGTYWVVGRWHANRGSGVFFVNWRTGVIYREWEQTASTKEEHIAEDIDSQNLLQALCSPLKRLFSKSELASGVYAPLGYEAPFAIVGSTSADAFAVESGVPLQLVRCGSHRHELLSGGGVSVQLGGNVLSWFGSELQVHPGIVYVMRLNVRGGLWHGPPYRLESLRDSESSNTLIQHTSAMVFATIGMGSSGGEIYAARIP
jgi:hypothetical protein